jgi:hypothetical protein
VTGCAAKPQRRDAPRWRVKSVKVKSNGLGLVE